MSAVARAPASLVAPLAQPTNDLRAVIALALSEDAGDRGDVSCLARIPSDVEAEAIFIAKADGVIAGISLADMIFNQVDPSLKVEWFESDGNYVHKGLQFGKVYVLSLYQGCARSIIVAERVVLNFMQRTSGIATLTKAMSDAARPACILEARKTATDIRMVDKWAVYYVLNSPAMYMPSHCVGRTIRMYEPSSSGDEVDGVNDLDNEFNHVQANDRGQRF